LQDIMQGTALAPHGKGYVKCLKRYGAPQWRGSRAVENCSGVRV